MKKSKSAQRGAILAEARISAHLSQAELGKRVGVAGRTVLRWEGGLSNPPNEKLRLVADVLRASNLRAGDRFAQLWGLAPVVRPPSDAELAARAREKRAAFDSSIYLAADALDVPASRFRATLKSWLAVVRGAGVTLAEAEEMLPDPRHAEPGNGG